MSDDQATPAVARVWHTQVTDKGALVPSVPDETRAQAEIMAIGWAGISAITVVEQPSRERVEALLDQFAYSANSMYPNDPFRVALLRLWGFDA